MIIYLVTNIINGKKYVGQTTLSVEKRLLSHIKSSKLKDRKTPLYHAFNKYDIDSFSVQSIDTASNLKELNEKEIFWINSLNSMAPNGYNVRLGGANGGKCSDELKIKISLSIKKAHSEGRKRKNYKHNEHTKLKISQSKLGKKTGPFTNEHKKNMSIAQIGIPKPKTKEWCERQRQCMTGRKQSEELKIKRAKGQQKAIICVNTGIVYESLKIAASENNLSRANLSSLLKKQKGYLRNKLTGQKLQFKLYKLG